MPPRSAASFSDRTFNTEAGQWQKHRWLGAVERPFQNTAPGSGGGSIWQSRLYRPRHKERYTWTFENSGIHFSSQAVISAYGPQQVLRRFWMRAVSNSSSDISFAGISFIDISFIDISSAGTVFSVPLFLFIMLASFLKYVPLCSRIRESGSGRCRPQSPVQIHRNIYWLCPW